MEKVSAFLLLTCMASVIICAVEGVVRPATSTCQAHREALNDNAAYTKSAYKEFSFEEGRFIANYSLRLVDAHDYEYIYDLCKNPTGKITEEVLLPLPDDERPQISVTFEDGVSGVYSLQKISFGYPENSSRDNPDHVALKLYLRDTNAASFLELHLDTLIIEADETGVQMNHAMNDYVRRFRQYGRTPEKALTREEDLSVLIPFLESMANTPSPVHHHVTNTLDVISGPCIFVPQRSLYVPAGFFGKPDL